MVYPEINNIHSANKHPYCRPASSHGGTRINTSNVGTHPRCVRRGTRFHFPGIKKEDTSFDVSSSKGAVTYSPDFSVPSARRGLTSLFGMGRGGTLVLWPPYSLFLSPSGNSLPALCDKNHRLEANALHSSSTGVISLRSLTTAVLFPGPPSPHGGEKPFAESFRVISTARLCHC